MEAKITTIVFLALFRPALTTTADSDGECLSSMFDGDSGQALLACKAQRAFQRNWFPDPIGGLFSYQTWNGMDGFWQNGIAIETMVNAMSYSNNTRYLSVVKNSLRELDELLLAYGPQPSFDDMAWYGLAYARVYEILKLPDFLRVSKDIFNWCWTNGWDSSGQCHGGIWFDSSFNAKQTIENTQIYKLGMKLANLDSSDPQSKTFVKRARLTWDFMIATGILDKYSFKVYDGISLSSCVVEDKQTTFTYTAGTLAGGLIEEYKLTKNKTLLQIAHNISSTVLIYLSDKGVLTEQCDPNDGCSLDARSFKGIFLRNLRYLIDIDPPKSAIYKKFIENNIKSIMNDPMCNPESDSSQCHVVYLDGPPAYDKTGPVFGGAWNFPISDARPMDQASALDLLIAAIPDSIRCVASKSCSFDPVDPPPAKLTCKDNPCPKDTECCEYMSSYTCCAPGQHCVDDFCE